MNLQDEILAAKSRVQHDLAAKVQSRFALRAESKHFLDLAKYTVKTAIEQGEDSALSTIATCKGN